MDTVSCQLVQLTRYTWPKIIIHWRLLSANAARQYTFQIHQDFKLSTAYYLESSFTFNWQ